jgi:hypothetical protein
MSKQKPSSQKPRVVTTKTVMTMKQTGEKICMLTAYDYLVAKYLDQVGIDHPRRRLAPGTSSRDTRRRFPSQSTI